MVEIATGFRRLKTWITRMIRISGANTFVGTDSGDKTTNDCNSFMGYQTGYSNVGGSRNNFIGYQAGYSNVGGAYNNLIGYQAGYSNVDGARNNFIGYIAGYSNVNGAYNNFIGALAGRFNVDGDYNNFMGYHAGYSNVGADKNNFIGALAGYSTVDGQYNSFVGSQCGYSNVSGNRNIFMGINAGYYETGDDKLILDNRERTNEADARVKALIYGVMADAIANQLVRLNGVLELTSIKNGSTQANAGAAANEVWKTNGHASLPDNVLMIGV